MPERQSQIVVPRGRRKHKLRLGSILMLLGAASCAGTPPITPPGTGAIWGQLRLVPREGVAPHSAGSAGYRSPALRDVRFVDYSRPGFAVIYVEGVEGPVGEGPVVASSDGGQASPNGTAQIAIRNSRHAAYFEPQDTAIRRAGSIVIRNETSRIQAVSEPVSGKLYRLEPGHHVEINQPPAGLHSFYLLEAAETTARVFVAPGPFAVAGSSGQFRLNGLPPGQTRIHTWHPYFPEVQEQVAVPRDGALHLDLEIGVIADERSSSDEP